MKLKDKISIAFSDVMNRKFRSLLTIIAISVGSLLLVAMMGLGDGIKDQTKKITDNFGEVNEINVYPTTENLMNGMTEANTTNNNQGMTAEDASNEQTDETSEQASKGIKDADLDKIAKIDGVDYIRATISSSVTSTKIGDGDFVDKTITVQGINSKYKIDFSKDLVAGSNITDSKNQVLVGESYLKRLNIEDSQSVVGKKIIIKLDYPKINGEITKEPKQIEATIAGVLKKKTTYSSNIIVDSAKVDEIQEFYTGKKNYVQDNGYDTVVAVSKDGYKVSDVSSRITNETGFVTFSLDMINASIELMSWIVKSILSIAGIIVLVVAALGLVNTMTMTLQEKRKMIGVMRSVGASRGNIRLIFIFQSVYLGLAGGILGALLSSIGIFFTNEVVIASDSFTIPITAFNIGVSIGITLFIAVIAGLIPSARAARLNVVEAVAEE